MTIRVPTELKDRLDRLAASTRRSRSFLASEAVSDYVARQLDIVESIEMAIEETKAGIFVPHEQAMDHLDAIIEVAIKRKADETNS